MPLPSTRKRVSARSRTATRAGGSEGRPRPDSDPGDCAIRPRRGSSKGSEKAPASTGRDRACFGSGREELRSRLDVGKNDAAGVRGRAGRTKSVPFRQPLVPRVNNVLVEAYVFPSLLEARRMGD